ncbi:putative aliphatic sulfonates transport permease protein SsuC [Sporotomaculum syntrophicum]|uniref:Aliphatic sulfonates transport permease protein SsuC n=1 Tax=Sporotomaculum syntrophicum TaxID=182264 RepID=A0A9D2WNZ6_9FIRM|nr:ABC transporter permease [Sporotomaculum syntrophicum]KAF1084789.1 putative aliphatic sulfonates transport permease protein SsuC [Sporotomaculum syntrophicum]
MKNSSWLIKTLVQFTGLVLFFALWQVLSGFYNHVIIPSPMEVVRSIIGQASSGELCEHGRQSIVRGLTGFGFALSIGTPLGLLIGLNPVAASLFRPVVVVFQVTPLISWLLLAMIWIGFSRVPVFIVFVTTLPLIVINVFQGVHSIDRQLLQMASVFKINKDRIIREIYLPQVAPYLMAGIANALGTTWKAVAMSEFLSVQTGIGASMAVARINLETADLFAWTITLIVLGMLTDRLLAYLTRRKLSHWM